MTQSGSGSEFAEFVERRGDLEPLPVVVRRVVPGDAEAVAEIHAARERLDPADVLPRVRSELLEIAAGHAGRYASVAVLDGRVVAYGKLLWMDLAADPRARAAPTGWYLSGVVVSPPFRRRGVALRLTEDRLDFLARERAPSVWYFVNVLNRASIALHARLGFEEVTRDFAIPDITFRGGHGILFRKDLTLTSH